MDVAAAQPFGRYAERVSPDSSDFAKIKDFPGAKSAGNEFSLSVGKRTFAKILLVPAKPVLRIEYGGAAAPLYHPFKSRFWANRVAHHLKRRYCSTFVCSTAFFDVLPDMVLVNAEGK